MRTWPARCPLPLLLIVAGSLLASVPARQCLAGEAQVDFELLTEAGFSLTGARKWDQLLRELGVANIRIRGGQNGEPLEIRESGSGQARRYRVTGVLTAKDQLQLPTGRPFKFADRAGIKAWLDRLRDGGEKELRTQRGTFGLSEEELVAVHDKLAQPLAASTKGKRIGEVARSIVQQVQLPYAVDPAARAAFTGDERVFEELQGLTCGTALAAAIRPLGLVLAPRREAGRVELLIADSRQLKEVWPVGWPLQDSPGRALPALFKYLNVAVNDTPLIEALDAIQQRVEAPFLYDHNSLARERIDLQTPISHPDKRAFYKSIIDRMLFQARLKCEVRADEAGKAFLWITTLRN